MIRIIPEEDIEALKKIFCDRNIEYNNNSSAVIAYDEDDIIGHCLFDLNKNEIIIKHIEPSSDIYLADGIIRSALHVATNRGVMTAKYTGTAPVELFEKLAFIKNNEKKLLKIEKLFESCQNCAE